MATNSDLSRSALAVAEQSAELSVEMKLVDAVKTTAEFAEELLLTLLLTDCLGQNQTVYLSQSCLSAVFH